MYGIKWKLYVSPNSVLLEAELPYIFFIDSLTPSHSFIDISKVEGAMDEMIKKANGKRTIPQIFFGDEHIGGYDEVRALEKENKLKDLLK